MAWAPPEVQGEASTWEPPEVSKAAPWTPPEVSAAAVASPAAPSTTTEWTPPEVSAATGESPALATSADIVRPESTNVRQKPLRVDGFGLDAGAQGVGLTLQREGLAAGEREVLQMPTPEQAQIQNQAKAMSLPTPGVQDIDWAMPVIGATRGEKAEAVASSQAQRADIAKREQAAYQSIENPVVSALAPHVATVGVPLAATGAMGPAGGAYVTGVQAAAEVQDASERRLREQGKTPLEAAEAAQLPASGAGIVAGGLSLLPGGRTRGVLPYARSGALGVGFTFTSKYAEHLATGEPIDFNSRDAAEAFATGVLFHAAGEAIHGITGHEPDGPVLDRLRTAKTPQELKTVVDDVRQQAITRAQAAVQANAETLAKQPKLADRVEQQKATAQRVSGELEAKRQEMESPAKPPEPAAEIPQPAVESGKPAPEIQPAPAKVAAPEEAPAPITDATLEYAAAAGSKQPKPSLDPDERIVTKDELDALNAPMEDEPTATKTPAATPPAAPTPEPKPEPVTSARKAMMAEDRESLGLSGLNSPERRSWQEALDKAESEGIPDRAMELAREVKETARPLTDIETAGIVRHAAKLKNDHARVMDEIGKLTDPAAIKLKNAEAMRIQQDFDLLSDAARLSGTEKGRALASQKLTINKDYQLVSVLNRAKGMKGGELKPAETSTLTEITKQMQGYEARISQLEAKASDRQVRDAMQTTRAKKYSRMTPEQRTAELQEKYSRLRELLKSGCNN